MNLRPACPNPNGQYLPPQFYAAASAAGAGGQALPLPGVATSIPGLVAQHPLAAAIPAVSTAAQLQYVMLPQHQQQLQQQQQQQFMIQQAQAAAAAAALYGPAGVGMLTNPLHQLMLAQQQQQQQQAAQQQQQQFLLAQNYYAQQLAAAAAISQAQAQQQAHQQALQLHQLHQFQQLQALQQHHMQQQHQQQQQNHHQRHHYSSSVKGSGGPGTPGHASAVSSAVTTPRPLSSSAAAASVAPASSSNAPATTDAEATVGDHQSTVEEDSHRSDTQQQQQSRSVNLWQRLVDEHGCVSYRSCSGELLSSADAVRGYLSRPDSCLCALPPACDLRQRRQKRGSCSQADDTAAESDADAGGSDSAEALEAVRQLFNFRPDSPTLWPPPLSQEQQQQQLDGGCRSARRLELKRAAVGVEDEEAAKKSKEDEAEADEPPAAQDDQDETDDDSKAPAAAEATEENDLEASAESVIVIAPRRVASPESRLVVPGSSVTWISAPISTQTGPAQAWSNFSGRMLRQRHASNGHFAATDASHQHPQQHRLDGRQRAPSAPDGRPSRWPEISSKSLLEFLPSAMVREQTEACQARPDLLDNDPGAANSH